MSPRPRTLQSHRTCYRCKESKPITAEYFPRKASDRTGFNSLCIPCNRATAREWRLANPGRRRGHNRLWKTQNRDKRRDSETARTYGVPKGTYLRLLAEQGGRCAICERLPFMGRPLGLDHDHVTGAARSLLCNQCNSAIGFLGDSPDLCRRALAYLERHGSVGFERVGDKKSA